MPRGVCLLRGGHEVRDHADEQRPKVRPDRAPLPDKLALIGRNPIASVTLLVRQQRRARDPEPGGELQNPLDAELQGAPFGAPHELNAHSHHLGKFLLRQPLGSPKPGNPGPDLLFNGVLCWRACHEEAPCLMAPRFSSTPTSGPHVQVYF